MKKTAFERVEVVHIAWLRTIAGYALIKNKNKHSENVREGLDSKQNNFVHKSLSRQSNMLSVILNWNFKYLITTIAIFLNRFLLILT